MTREFAGVNSGHPSHVSNVSKHQTIVSKRKSKSKSAMTRHPIRPFDTIICVSEFWASQLCFFAFKPCNYGLQERLMSKKVAPPQKMFRTPKNRQARNHPILLLGSLGTQKTRSGLSAFQNQGMFFFHPWGPRGPKHIFKILVQF